MGKNIVKLLKEISMGELRNTIAKTLNEKDLANVAGGTMNLRKSVAACLTALIIASSPILGSANAVKPWQGVDNCDTVYFGSTPAELARSIHTHARHFFNILANLDSFGGSEKCIIVTIDNTVANSEGRGTTDQLALQICVKNTDGGRTIKASSIKRRRDVSEFTGRGRCVTHVTADFFRELFGVEPIVGTTIDPDRVAYVVNAVLVAREAEEKAKQEAEEQKRKEAEEKAKKEAEEKAKKEAKEQAEKSKAVREKRKKADEEKAKKAAAEKAKKAAEENAAKKAKEKAAKKAQKKADFLKTKKEEVVLRLKRHSNHVDARGCETPEDVFSKLPKAAIGSSEKKVKTIVFVCPGFKFDAGDAGVGLIVAGDRNLVNTALMKAIKRSDAVDTTGYAAFFYDDWEKIVPELSKSRYILFVIVGDQSTQDALQACCHRVSPEVLTAWEAQAVDKVNGSDKAMRKRKKYEEKEKEIIATWISEQRNVDARGCENPEDVFSTLPTAAIGSSGKKVQTIIFVCPGAKFDSDVNPGVGLVVAGNRNPVNIALTNAELLAVPATGYKGLNYNGWCHLLPALSGADDILFVNVGSQRTLNDLCYYCDRIYTTEVPTEWEERALAAANGSNEAMRKREEAEEEAKEEVASWLTKQSNYVDASDCKNPDDIFSELTKAGIGSSGKEVQTIIYVCPGFKLTNAVKPGVALTVTGKKEPVDTALEKSGLLKATCEIDTAFPYPDSPCFDYSELTYSDWEKLASALSQTTDIAFALVNARTILEHVRQGYASYQYRQQLNELRAAGKELPASALALLRAYAEKEEESSSK